MVQIQRRRIVLALFCSVGFTSADQQCVNRASCTGAEGAEVDAVSLMQTGRWVYAKNGKEAPASDDAELLQTGVTVQQHRATVSGDGQDENAPRSSFRKYAARIIDKHGNESSVLLQALLAQQDGLVSDCTPKCTWKCQSQECDQVCKPTCQAPVCETRCQGMDTSNCNLDCAQPECAVVCPPNQCTNGCAECQTQCTEPKCKLNCPNAQPCRNVCEEPRCEFHCSAPSSCPEPRCQLQCEKPTPCQASYNHAPLPPLQNGEVSIKSFNAMGEHAPPPGPVVTPMVTPATAPCSDNPSSTITVTSLSTEYVPLVDTPCSSSSGYGFSVPAPTPASKGSDESGKGKSGKAADAKSSKGDSKGSDQELLAQPSKAAAAKSSNEAKEPASKGSDQELLAQSFKAPAASSKPSIATSAVTSARTDATLPAILAKAAASMKDAKLDAQ